MIAHYFLYLQDYPYCRRGRIGVFFLLGRFAKKEGEDEGIVHDSRLVPLAGDSLCTFPTYSPSTPNRSILRRLPTFPTTDNCDLKTNTI
jgi:hypothetical protein